MGQALDKQDAYQLGLNDLLVSKKWIELLDGTNDDRRVNPKYFKDRCPFLYSSFKMKKTQVSRSKKDKKCPAYMSW